MKLNLGCGDRHQAGYVNVDICEPADIVFDLSQFPWPWETSSVDEVISDDFIEHIEGDKKIALMNELHRVLVPDGLLKIQVPTTDGPGAWCDPTHKSWWHQNSFWYYTKGNPAYERFHKPYGITACFHVQTEKLWEWEGMPLLTLELRAVK